MQKKGFGNGLCIPAGPLREPVAQGLRRADAILSIGAKTAQDSFAKLWKAQIPCPHATARLNPLATGVDWSKEKCVAFAGIGHPEKFFKTLDDLGANLVHKEAPQSCRIFKCLAQTIEAHGKRCRCSIGHD